MPKLVAEGNPVVGDIVGVGDILELDLSDIQLGFTGAPSFGQLDQLHDLDLIFSGTLEENKAIVQAMRNTYGPKNNVDLQRVAKDGISDSLMTEELLYVVSSLIRTQKTHHYVNLTWILLNRMLCLREKYLVMFTQCIPRQF